MLLPPSFCGRTQSLGDVVRRRSRRYELCGLAQVLLGWVGGRILSAAPEEFTLYRCTHKACPTVPCLLSSQPTSHVPPTGDLHRHSMDAGHLCSAMVQLRAMAHEGGEFSVEAGHGGAGTSAHAAVWAHGIIMIIGWLALLPAGAWLAVV